MTLKSSNPELYREELLQHLEPAMNRMMLIGACGAFISFVNTLMVRPDAWVHVIFTSATTVLLLTLRLLDRRISADTKIITVTSFLTLYSGVLLLTDNQLAGILMVFMNVVLIVFFQKFYLQWIYLTITSILVVVSFIATARWDVPTLSNLAYSLTIYLVLISIMPIAFRAIHFFLYHKLHLLQQKLTAEEQNMALLQSKSEEIEQLAYFDRLTGLYNRHRISQLINHDLAQGKCHAIVFIDVKNFRKINALYGIRHADIILSDIARFMLQKVEMGIVGSLGANAFVVSAQKPVERLEYIDKVLWLQQQINVSANLAINIELHSVCFIPEPDNLLAEDYYKLAEDHLANMKAQGVAHKYIDETEKQALQAAAQQKLFILNSIDSGSYDIHYQEKFNVKTQRVVGVEALARLRRDGQFISPAVFIPIVEADEHIIAFGYMIMALVFSHFARITSIYGDIRVSINLSPKQLADKDLYPKIKHLLLTHHIDPGRVELEITENQLITNFSEFNDVIFKLKALGIKFSIDDFGTGYSSLGYLSELPVDVLKIDKSFVDTIHTDQKQQAIVRAILDIAKSSQMEIVAEGVETIEQLQALQNLGVDVIQGYLHARPQPLPH